MVSPKEVHEIIGRHMLADGFDMVVDFPKSRGPRLYDARNERYLLDFFSFFASMPLGANHPRMMEPEVLEELKRAAVHKPTNSDIYTVEMAEFVEEFSRSALPPYLHYLFFISGGALAVENALKTAFDWKIRKNLAAGKGEVGTQVIHLEEAFHGRTGYTLSLTNTFVKEKVMYFPKFPWPRVRNPKITFPLEGDNLRRVEEVEQESLAQIEKAIEEKGDDIAAFLMEPIQGEGGDNHFRREYFQAVRKITLENDIFFIMDEVQSGLGLTGLMWAHQHYGVEPDAIAFGKKTQVCGIAVSRRVDEVEDNVFHVSSRLNSTWGGNLVDMVRAKHYLRIIREDGLVDNAARVGGHLLKRLEEIQEAHPSLVSNARGRGLMCAFDLPDHLLRDRFKSLIYKAGVVMIGCGEKTMRFRPPLDITVEAVDEGMDVIDRVLGEMERDA
ncbi:MAG: L-lysine 6-transaminase [Thermoplasmata archaeon]|nr:L-lysine 6-transaminase [Thermoplasmata archaeon]